MDEKKKKQYIIFISIALVAIIAIYLMPSPGKAKSVPYVPPLQIAVNDNKKIASDGMEELQSTTESVSAISDRKVTRDIFRNPLLVQEQPKAENYQQNQTVQTPRVQKEFKITGILMAGNRKSFVLSDGRIVSENETVDGYNVIKIGRGEVIFMSKADKSVMQVKVWEDKK